MGKGIKFQVMRSIKSGKNRWLLVGFLVYIIGFCVFLGFKERGYDETQKSILNYELQDYGAAAKLITEQLQDIKDSDEGYEQLKEQNDFYQSQYNSSMLMINLIDKRLKGSKESAADSINFIKAKQMKYEGIKDGYANGVIDDEYLKSKTLSIEEVDMELSYVNLMIDTKAPVAINPYTLSGESFLRNFFTGANIVVVLGFILLFVIDSYVIELRDDCYKTIYTSPVRRNKILLSKIISSYILICLVLAMGVLIGLVVVSLIFGAGHLSSSVQMNEGANGLKLMVENINHTYMSLSSVAIFNFISFLVFVLFIVIFSISLSVYTSNDILSLGVMISFILMTYLIHSVGGFMNINRAVNPFAYIFLEDISQFHLRITNIYGIVMQLILSGLILGLTTLKFKKQDLFGVMGD